MKDKKPEINGKTVKRLLKMITTSYKKRLVLVFICLVISSVVSVSAPLFIRKIIDDYTIPLLNTSDLSFEGLRNLIFIMAGVSLVGVITNYIYNRLMVDVAQGTLKKIRDTMFSKMQKLPIKYFDTNTHGDIMSHYTNDTDTLEQMISQSLPQLISSILSIIAVSISMIALNIPLTIFVFLFVFIMLQVTKKITRKSGSYFIEQQNSLGKVNGYIEEMINGQKVVKVFNYEERAEHKFDELNENLFSQMTNANRFSNILMPVLHNLGNLEYALVAIFGAYLTISGKMSGLTIGTISSFLGLTRSFNQPIKNVSSQVNTVVMAIAGATRIFELIDEPIESDDGYVTLVNANIDEQGNLIEWPSRTGKWAWKYKHKNGRVEYIELKGDIRFENVNFGYEPGKQILHNISLYAKPGQKIAFVGATGAGKTTITNLINRFYDIEERKD